MKLKEIRQSLKMTQEEFACKAGISRSYYSKLETGKSSFQFPVIKKLCKAHRLVFIYDSLKGYSFHFNQTLAVLDTKTVARTRAVTDAAMSMDCDPSRHGYEPGSELANIYIEMHKGYKSTW